MSEGPLFRRPPSDPKPLPNRGGADWTGANNPYDGPARLQMLAVVLLGLILVAVPLYLWRRPRSVASPVSGDASAPDGGFVDAGDTMVEIDAGVPSGVRLSDARVLECHDTGSKKTPSEQCDAIPQFTKSFGDAILAAKDCMPSSAGPGSVTYMADVSFTRKRSPVNVTLPKDGRSYRALKTVAGCASAVKAAVSALSLEGMTHAHTRYKVAIIATYPVPDAGQGGGDASAF
jgi:hypothetical protein